MENKDKNPVYYNNAEEMNKPVSELIEELRTELSRIRGKMHDIRRSYGFKDNIECLEGGITCVISAAYNTMDEIKKCEEAMRLREGK